MNLSCPRGDLYTVIAGLVPPKLLAPHRFVMTRHSTIGE